MKKYKGVIFDLDGLLIDSERMGIENAVKVAERMNVPITREVVKKTIGITYADTIACYLEHVGEKDKLDAFSKKLDTDDDHYFNSTMLIFVQTKDEEELTQIEEKLMNAASLKSVKLKTCFGKQREALNTVLPLGIQEFKRVVNLSSSCLAMLMPFKTQELNDANGIYYGINQLSQNVIFADKKLLKNHNGLILGQSGSGKSVFSKSEIISTFVNYAGDQIIIIDPQSEYGSLAAEVDGTVISFDSTKEYYLNPMDVDFEGVDYGRLQEIVAEKADFILTLLSSCLRRDILPEEQGIIDKVIDHR